MSNPGAPFCKCLLFSANALSRAITRMADEEFGVLGLSYSHAFILMRVNKVPGKPIGELVEDLMLSASTITRLVEKLEEKHFIERKSEGRSTFLFPTPEGLRLDPHLRLAWQNVFRRYSDLLGKDHAVEMTSHIYDAALALGHNPDT